MMGASKSAKARRGLSLAVAAAATMVTFAGGAQAQEREVRSFTMSGPWSLDAGDDYCRLAANFTNGADEIGFALERNRAENVARLVLVGDAIRTFRRADTMGYTFLPSGEARSAMFTRSETADGKPWFNLGLVAFAPAGPPVIPQPPYDRAAELQFAAGVNALLVDDGLQTPIRIETGPLRAPMQALQACADDLLLHWGLDYAKHRTMTRRATPVAPPFEWVATGTLGFADFPLFSGARNPFRVMVSAEGRPTSCTVHWPSLTERKNAGVCEQLMANARFEPALDAEGQPMASYWAADPFLLMRPMGGRGR
jgi:hypothetical protein